MMSSEDILTAPPPAADARVPYGSDPNQFGDLRLPKGKAPFPAVINIHGGFWRAKYDLGHAGHLCAALASEGIATWNVEYRRVGNRGGGWPGTFEDIVAAHHFLQQKAREFKIDERRIAVMGHSAGGQLALCLAAYRNVSAIALAGVVDLTEAWKLHLSHDAVAEFMGGSPKSVADRYRQADPMQLSIRRAKQYIVHGSQDDVVPPAFSRTYVQRKTGKREKVRLLEIRGADHYDPINPRSKSWATVIRAAMDAVSE
jgi:acetyl esterase/lipase